MGGGFPPESQAQQAPAWSVQVGFGGYVRTGTLNPIWFTFTGTDTDHSLRLSFYLPNDRSIYQYDFVLPAHTTKTLHCWFYIPSFVANIGVKVEWDGGKSEREIRVTTLGEELFIGVVSHSPEIADAITSRSKDVVVTWINPTFMPTSSLLLEPLDVLILQDLDPNQWSSQQRDAIVEWTRWGGHLIFGGSGSVVELIRYFPDLAPAHWNGTAQYDATVWEPLGMWVGADPPSEGLSLIQLEMVEDAYPLVYSEENGIPLIVRRRVGDGIVDLLAWDLTAPPFRLWKANQKFWTEFLVGNSRRMTGVSTYPSYSYSISTSFGLVLARLFPSPWLILAIFLAYILIMGPVTLIVLRILKRSTWIWGAVPAWAVIFLLILYLAGGKVQKKDLSHYVAFSYLRSPTHTVLSQEKIGFYTPSGKVYPVTFAADTLLFPDTSGGQRWRIKPQSPSTITGLDPELGRLDLLTLEKTETIDGEVQLSVRITGVISNTWEFSGIITNTTEWPLTNPTLILAGSYYLIAPRLEPGQSLFFRSRDLRSSFSSGYVPSVPNLLSVPLSVYQQEELSADPLLSLWGFNDPFLANRGERQQIQDIFAAVSMLNARIEQSGLSFADPFIVAYRENAPFEVQPNRDLDVNGGTIVLIEPTLTLQIEPQVTFEVFFAQPRIFYAKDLDTDWQGKPMFTSPSGTVILRYLLPFQLTKLGLSADALFLQANSSMLGMLCSLRNVQTGKWFSLTHSFSNASLLRLDNPERFITPGGELFLRCENVSSSLIPVDFTVGLELTGEE